MSITLTIILPSSFSHSPNRIQHARTILIYRRKRIGWRDLVTLEVQLKWREEESLKERREGEHNTGGWVYTKYAPVIFMVREAAQLRWAWLT